MLLKNEIKPVHALAMHLYFDDGSEKIDTVREGDILSIEYRREFKKLKGTGKVVKIANIYYPGSENISAVLTMDFADKYESTIIKIPTEDILDFDKIVVRKPNSARIGHANIGGSRLE